MGRLAGLAMLFAALALFATTGAAQTLAPDEALRLTVYTSHKEEVYRPIVEEFERRTGVWVRVVEGGTSELLARIAQESDDPQADVMFGGGVESLMAYERCFDPYAVDGAALREDCAFSNNRFVAFSRLPLVIICNPRLIDDPPSGWAELLDAQWAGRIAFADPGVSGSSYTALATMMQALGGADVLARFAGNVRGHVLSGSGDVINAVAGGAYPVGVTLYETAKKRILDGEQITILWPCEGTSAVPDGAAIIAGCRHPQNARLFLDFILGEDVQRRVQTEYARLTVRSDLVFNAADAKQGPLCAYDIPWASEARGDILARWRVLMGEGEP